MKRIFIVIVSLLFLLPIHAYGSEISASSAIVMDAQTGNVLYEHNAYDKRPMASTTKIMTALLAIESKRLNETVEITNEMVNVEGSSMGIKAGDKLTLLDLITGMMLTSGNDSANSVAIFISGSVESFADLMNKRAHEIGMNSTFFVTPSGLDEGEHHSTAYDMALLCAAAIQVDTFCEIVSKQSADLTISGKTVTVYNHNKLLAKDKEIFGVKTGFTKKAGRCLVSAKNYNGNQLICVTLNAPDDWNDHINLFKECQQHYKTVTIQNKIQLSTAFGDKKSISCSYSKNYYVLGEIRTEEYYYPFVYPPVTKGEKVGEVCVYYCDRMIERLPIEADEDLKNYGEQQSCTTSEIYGGVRRGITQKK